MKRKRLDRDIWTRIVSSEYAQRAVCDEALDGIIALLKIKEVDHPSIWGTPCGDAVACESDMLWVEYLPACGNYLITAMLNPRRNTVIYYIDILAQHGRAEDGVAWYDDLYLDVVVYQNGSILIDDVEEFEAAFAAGEIDDALYALGKNTVEALLKSPTTRRETLNRTCREILRRFEMCPEDYACLE